MMVSVRNLLRLLVNNWCYVLRLTWGLSILCLLLLLMSNVDDSSSTLIILTLRSLLVSLLVSLLLSLLALILSRRACIVHILMDIYSVNMIRSLLRSLLLRNWIDWLVNWGLWLVNRILWLVNWRLRMIMTTEVSSVVYMGMSSSHSAFTRIRTLLTAIACQVTVVVINLTITSTNRLVLKRTTTFLNCFELFAMIITF